MVLDSGTWHLVLGTWLPFPTSVDLPRAKLLWGALACTTWAYMALEQRCLLYMVLVSKALANRYFLCMAPDRALVSKALAHRYSPGRALASKAQTYELHPRCRIDMRGLV